MPVRPGTVTIVGRGQVHVFARTTVACTARSCAPATRCCTPARPHAPIPPGCSIARDSQTIASRTARRSTRSSRALHTESRRAPEPRSAEIARHLLLTLLLWLERWHDADQGERDDADTALFRRFSTVLERDFARHHEARHYADALAVPQPVLTRALRAVTGKGRRR